METIKGPSDNYNSRSHVDYILWKIVDDLIKGLLWYLALSQQSFLMHKKKQLSIVYIEFRKDY